ncbi:MAG: 1-acyl-sn-glycerol-3-phosphate acyltransferase [Candidatus Muiribacterium halophilum]|uniref:1-acyl-sn-glycerol-3-phosphate acyltransferase n=1 Tax=Muiribacterium halophilum TaxID=2053465 RepID=A0A2N5ZK78_MUIH1|nr:MAG: 1-acyl-sn-glycerol-3-phosphate acyltransferase [Candidatus Muirbacterium halophilum]
MNLFDVWLAKKSLWFMFKAFFITFDVIGIENLPKEDTFIIASNHQSNIDPMIIFYNIPTPVCFMAKKELFSIPVFSWILGQLGNFSVRRNAFDKTSIQTAVQRIENGQVIALFPEGTRSKDGKIKKFKSCVSYIMKHSGFKQVVPVYIKGSRDLLKKGDFLPNPVNITLKIGKPLIFTEKDWDDNNKKTSAENITAKVEEKVRKMADE